MGVYVLQELFAVARVVVSLAFLVYASWSDYKTREVTNRVWSVYAPIGLSLSLIEILIFNLGRLWLFGLCVSLTVGISLLLFYTGGFGGADSKALICISFTLPFFPSILFTPILSGGLSPLSQTLFPITILSNAVLVAASSGIFLLIRNLFHKATTGKPLFEGTLAKESLGKKILVLVTGQRFPISTLKAKWHIYPLEDIGENCFDGQPQRKLLIIPKDEGRDEIINRLSDAAEVEKISSKVWATPGLPMLIFVSIGLLLALSLGDIVWILVSYLFG